MLAKKILRGSQCAEANDQRLDCDQSGVVAMAPLLCKWHGHLRGRRASVRDVFVRDAVQ